MSFSTPSPPSPPSPFDSFQDTANKTFTNFTVVYVVVAVVSVAGMVAIVYFIYKCVKNSGGLPSVSVNVGAPVPAMPATSPLYATATDAQLETATVEDFLQKIAGEKPIRFTPAQLAGFTSNYATRLGAGGFGEVFKGRLPNGVLVAVKVLRDGAERRLVEEQFMAEVSTIGRTYHVNLVRLYGFCFDAGVRALVYEFMPNGSLDGLLFSGRLPPPAVLTVAVGAARGIRYLHEECEHRIIHYDIKPGNVLLDGDLKPKVADFGLAKLTNPGSTHVSMTAARGTPGYAAPEMWTMGRVTEKCDVYSYGMMLFEMATGKRNFDAGAPESQQWQPMQLWKQYGGPPASVPSAAPAVVDEVAEKMCRVAFWCVQQAAEARPAMSGVVKMLEGEMEVPLAPNPFQHLMALAAPPAGLYWSSGSGTTAGGGRSAVDTALLSWR